MRFLPNVDLKRRRKVSSYSPTPPKISAKLKVFFDCVLVFRCHTRQGSGLPPGSSVLR